jgi:folate-binding protein YgfZ
MTTVAAAVVRDVITVSGPDAAAYLQGQVSQDVDALTAGESAWSFVLQPQGKVDAWFRLTRTGADRFTLDVDAGHGEALLARLRRFLLRTEAELSLDTVPMVAVRGRSDVEVPEGAMELDPAWPGVDGVDLLGTDAIPAGLTAGTVDELERLRIETGVPAMGAELTGATIPAEAGVVERSVSFTKGCFTGQELVARIDSRGGNVPRHLRRLVAEGDEGIAVGADVVVAGRVVGTVTSSAPRVDDRPAVALAYVGRAVEPPAAGTVDGADVRIEALP